VEDRVSAVDYGREYQVERALLSAEQRAIIR